jgi:hypothetical protein
MMMWAAHIGHMVYVVLKPAGKKWPRDNEKKGPKFLNGTLMYRMLDITAICFLL